MSHNKYNEDQIGQILRKMPQVEDQQHKDQLFELVSSNLNKNKHEFVRKKRRAWLLPSFASIVVVLVMAVMIQSFMSNSNYEHTESNDRADIDMNTFEAPQEDSAQIPPSAKDEAEISSMDEAETRAQDNNSTMLDSLKSHVVQSEHPYNRLIHVAALDENVNHIIPITLQTDEQVELESYYNHLDKYLDVEQLGLVAYPFEGVTFNVSLEQEKVMLEVAESYNFGGGGGAIQGAFEGMLSTMFRPYGVKEAVVQYAGERRELGMLGEIDHIDLSDTHTQLYKIYQNEEDSSRQYLTPLNTERNIRSAIQEMRNNEHERNIQASIPNDIYLTVESNDKQLIIGLSAEASLENNQETLDMVEAILMTAKSYGYQTVTFDIGIDRVGPYNLREEIPVPTAVNPIEMETN
ncbi:hypothetical protein [Aquibacillus sediminis]|uniref:hypothetical protein n=1 Tax=Aquibacillus sediminis TaxID=2574734 RepID=UPI001109F82E|nr:hypothetical protein [Aquibacillus sediminis]